MNLPDDKQQNIQRPLDFSALTGEARGVAEEETESSGATSGNESPARTDRLMEEVCERENLKEALRQVKANQGSAGVDGMTVGGITDYLKQHWPTIRERLLNGTYEPQPVRRVEIPKPDGGIRKLGIQRDPGGFQVSTRGFATHTGGLLDTSQRPSQPSQYYHLLFLFFRQDIAHTDAGYEALRRSQCPGWWVIRWPVLR